MPNPMGLSFEKGAACFWRDTRLCCIGMSGKAILVCGEDAFLVARKTRMLLDELAPAAERAFGLETVDGQTVSPDEAIKAVWQALEAVGTVGFLSTGKLVCLKSPADIFEAGKQLTKTAARAAEATKALMTEDAIPDGHVLLVSAGAVNRQSALYKAFAKHAEVYDFPVGTKPNELRKHAAAQLTALLDERGLRMNQRVRELFLARAGSETWRLAGEVAKLDLYTDKRREISEQDVADLTSLGDLDAAWDLTDAFGERDLTKTIAALRRLLGQRFAPIALAGMIENRLRDLLVFREASDRRWLRFAAGAGWGAPPPDWSGLPEAAAGILETMRPDPRRMHPYRASQMQRQASRYSLRELRNARHLMNTLRERLVSTGVSGELVLELTLLRIVGSRTSKDRTTPAKGRSNV